MKTFPKPLTAEEETYYLGKLREGDEKARRILIEYNLRLVAHVVKKYHSCDEDMEELISIGTIGLIKAVDTFDPERAGKLATYAARCVENEVLMYLRGRKKHLREASYYEPIGVDKEGNEIRLLEVLESGEPAAFDQIGLRDDTLKIYRLLENALSERERQVLIMRYGLYRGKEYTQREIAEQMGISRSYISRIEKNALNHLREYFRD
ncbi:MAG: RNA polymerase sporulation sigma factor SigK [Lachnospiraceae bacterium]|nr:RNA polymerase sporulation sigma factor SigK [Lachnospiraceae bacterium]